MKIKITALLIIFYLNVSAQEILKFETKSNKVFEPVFKVNPDGTFIVKDSLKAIQFMYKELLKTQKERDFLVTKISDIIIENSKFINNQKTK